MEFQSITDNLTANDIISMSRPLCKRNKVKNLILSCQMFLDFVDGGTVFCDSRRQFGYNLH